MATIKDLKFDDKNFNKHTKDGMALLGESLQKFGAGRSILIDKDNNIIAGNGIVEAAGQAGLENVKIIETTGDEIVAVKRVDVSLDSAQGREMALADNATGSADLAWDEDLLKENFGRDILDKWNVGLDWEPEAVEEDEAPEVDADSVKSEFGKVYKLGGHRVMCGDSTDANDVATLMGGQKADMVFTDPPYNVAIGDKNKVLNEKNGTHSIAKNIEGDNFETDEVAGEKLWLPAFKNMRENAEDSCAIYVTMPQGGTHMMMMMMMMNEAGWNVKHELIWVKNAPTFSLGRLDYDYKHEPICFGWNKTHKNLGKGEFKTSVWNIDKPRKSDLHPTMKPVRLVANAILDSTRERERVLDLFGGSGTTMVACEQLGRKCFMMELDPHYCDVIRKRWWKLTHDTEDGWEEGTPSL